VELGVVIGKAGRHIGREQAMAHVEGYVLALDMTARNLQVRLRYLHIPSNRQ
jgi:acylpyruvate hydrolase